jgi:5'(3')-deoxyribonucleotidase
MKALGIPDADARAIYASMEVPGLCRSIPVYPGAKEGLARIREFADTWAVTAPFGGEHWMHERDQWLIENLGFKSNDILHVRSAAKPAVLGDYLVEDKTSTLIAWDKVHGTNGTGILFRRLYNQRDDWHGFAVSDWSGLVSLFEELQRIRTS